jgi:hypothetical protein
MAELIVYSIIAFVLIFLFKWVGAWMLGVTNVLDKQDKALEAMNVMNKNLERIIEHNNR